MVWVSSAGLPSSDHNCHGGKSIMLSAYMVTASGSPGELAHSVAVGRGKLVVIGFGVVGKAGCQGGGVRVLMGGSVGRDRDGVLDRVVCSLLAFGIDVEVVVGAERQRDAHHGMGDLGSNSAARRKERSASPWLKP